MVRFLTGDADPIIQEFARQACIRKARDDIPYEVDRVQLDMGEGVQ